MATCRADWSSIVARLRLATPSSATDASRPPKIRIFRSVLLKTISAGCPFGRKTVSSLSALAVEHIPDAMEGYLSIGAPELEPALRRLRPKCRIDGKAHENAILHIEPESIEGNDWPYPNFAAFTSFRYSAPAAAGKTLFWDRAMYEECSRALAANRCAWPQVLGMMDQQSRGRRPTAVALGWRRRRQASRSI